MTGVQTCALPISLSFAWLFLLVPMHLALVWGLSLLLSAITPYFRDTTEFLRIFMTVNIFLIPVMYLPSAVPHALQFIVYLNPFSHLIFCYHDVLYDNAILHPESWGFMAAFSLLSLMAGSYVFLRLRHHIGSIL